MKVYRRPPDFIEITINRTVYQGRTSEKRTEQLDKLVRKLQKQYGLKNKMDKNLYGKLGRLMKVYGIKKVGTL